MYSLVLSAHRHVIGKGRFQYSFLCLEHFVEHDITAEENTVHRHISHHKKIWNCISVLQIVKKPLRPCTYLRKKIFMIIWINSPDWHSFCVSALSQRSGRFVYHLNNNCSDWVQSGHNWISFVECSWERKTKANTCMAHDDGLRKNKRNWNPQISVETESFTQTPSTGEQMPNYYVIYQHIIFCAKLCFSVNASGLIKSEIWM